MRVCGFLCGALPIKYFTTNAVKREKKKEKQKKKSHDEQSDCAASAVWVLITSEKAPFTWLSTPQMLTDHFAFLH